MPEIRLHALLILVVVIHVIIHVIVVGPYRLIRRRFQNTCNTSYILLPDGTAYYDLTTLTTLTLSTDLALREGIELPYSRPIVPGVPPNSRTLVLRDLSS